MKNKRKPVIQFEKNKESWKEIKAGSIFYSLSDKNHPNLPVLSASQEKGMVFRDQIGIDIQYNVESTKNYKRVVPGQFVIHLRSFQGGFAFSAIEGITSPAYTVLDFKNKEEQDVLFWKHVFSSKTFIKKLESVTYGIRDGRSISFSDFSTLKFIVPNYEAQKKIGSFFKDLDDLIFLHQQELDAFKQTKQCFLQKMFPKEGGNVPEIRFEGFSGEWESKTFSSLVNRTSKQSNSDILPKLEFEDIISGEGKLNKNISNKFDNRKGILFEPGYILFGKLRPYLKNWLLPDFKGIALGDFWVFTTAYYAEFIYSLIQSSKFQTVANLSSGTKMPRSDWKTVSSTEFMIPSMQEQVKIGEFFKHLDEVIHLKDQELEALKQTKQGFLQKMFV